MSRYTTLCFKDICTDHTYAAERFECTGTVAYLLCRIADTVEDSDGLSIDEKKDMLTVYANIFVKDDPDYYTEFNKLIKKLPNDTPDDELTHNFPVVFEVFDSFSKMIKTQIGRWVAEMSMGMHKYAQSRYSNR